MKRLIVLILVFGVFFDQFFKVWLPSELLVINRGVAFGWWVDVSWFLVGACLVVWAVYTFKWNWWLVWFVSGALSNLIDRFRVGGVIDYLEAFGIYFNLADVMIVVSAMGLIYSELYGAKETI